ncbi:glycoside hydrolase family 3 N-terminal domain-containing protein [Flavicella sediminum]|uniref:glycoside hydrolase family 3 N-terminal domain-containing protein n=1 Tax=Flavicella sediminum TaxID=2585141 RepID=UPI00111FDFEF|nr:glycoside hydrolase family 3 N-terminal domain-containing protein [Flavicella sediminum]
MRKAKGQKQIVKSCLVVLLACFSNLNAQQLDPLLTKDAAAQKAWVSNKMVSMTLNEKIGQLFMVQAYSNLDEKHARKIEAEIKKHHIGGLIFMQGTPEKQAVLNNRYQKKSKIPLLIGFDGEWGLDMRLKKTFRYPWNMTLGAVSNDLLLEQFGQRLGVHCKRLGIHINFAPVVDINTNPENPIIGNRSFGENKFNVTQKAAAFIKGMQSEGVLANAKHFPGHGDTAKDSHKTLPQLNFDLKRLEAIEMYPYAKLFDSGLTSIMAAHLSVPVLEPNPEIPTSISYKVITQLLKQKMGFNGLIFTDALNMKGAANYAKPGDIDLAAFMAGNDILLIPEDVGAAVKKIKTALKRNILTMSRLNHSVEKILKAKYWAGLHHFEPIKVANIEADLNTIKDSVLHRKLVEQSMTLLNNKNGIFPIKELANKRIAYVKIGDADNSSFVTRLQSYADVKEIHYTSKTELLGKLQDFDQVIIGYHKSNATPWRSFKFSTEEIDVLQSVAKAHKTIVSVFASPYSLLQLKYFDNIEGLLLAYQNSYFAQDIAAQAIFGAVETHGKLPVTINENYPEGFGLHSVNLMRLSYGIPESVGVSSAKLQKIDSVMKLVISEKMAPGGQVLVARHGKVIYEKSFGYYTYEQKQAVTNSSIFDLASLTKILGGLPLIMKSEELGLFTLSQTLGNLLPEYKDSNKDTLTVKEMLSHTARLQAWIPFYLETIDSLSKNLLDKYYSKSRSAKFGIEVAKEVYLRTDYIDSIYQKIKEVKQRETPGYKYSGLAFFMFKKFFEENYHSKMEDLADGYFYKSLGAYTLTYNPLRKFEQDRIVPSEIDRYFRHQILQGHVHDMGAAMMGGVSGNAGLFSNANDVAKFMQMYLQDGYYGGQRYLSSHTLKKFNTRYFKGDQVRRGLGFDKPQLDPEVLSTCGCVSDNSFGHSGFTGTYTWADPDSGLLYVFLSNRTYPTMDNNKLGKEDIRTKIQALAVDAIVE